MLCLDILLFDDVPDVIMSHAKSFTKCKLPFLEARDPHFCFDSCFPSRELSFVFIKFEKFFSKRTRCTMFVEVRMNRVQIGVRVC